MAIKITSHRGDTARTFEVDEIEFFRSFDVSRVGRKARIRVRDRDTRRVADEADELALVSL